LALITPAEARYQIPGLTGTGEDTLLTELISAAGAMMARWCGHPPATVGAAPTMESASYTRYQDGPGGTDLRLDVYPVTAISSIYDSPDRSYAAADLVASGDYTLTDGERGLVTLDWDSVHGSWSTGLRAIKATWTAGFSSPPDELQHACRLTVRHLYDLRQVQGRTSQAVAGVSVGMVQATHLPDEVRRILAPYRLARSVVPV